MSRKVTPDIMGNLMGETINPESKKAIKQVNNPAGLLENHNAVKAVLREKATFSLPRSTLTDLEDMWIEIRRLRGDKRISKTDIVEQALAAALKEFRLKKSLSPFCSKLENNNSGKQ